MRKALLYEVSCSLIVVSVVNMLALFSVTVIVLEKSLPKDLSDLIIFVEENKEARNRHEKIRMREVILLS